MSVIETVVESCVKVDIDCKVETHVNSYISCEEFSSRPLSIGNKCNREVILVARAKNIFDGGIALGHQFDDGNMVINRVPQGGALTIGPQTILLNICKDSAGYTPGNLKRIGELKVTSSFRRGSEPLQPCLDEIRTVYLSIPTNTHHPTTLPSLFPSNRPSISFYPTIIPTTASPTKALSSNPTQMQSENPTIEKPTSIGSEYPTLSLEKPTLTPSEELPICVSLQTNCLVDDASGGTVTCSDFGSLPPTSNNCNRKVHLSIIITNLMDLRVGINFRVDGVSRTKPLEIEEVLYLPKLEKAVDICDTGNDAIEIFHIGVISRYIDSSSIGIQNCKDINQTLFLPLPQGTIFPTVSPTRKPSLTPSFSPTEEATIHQPNTTPTPRQPNHPSSIPSNKPLLQPISSDHPQPSGKPSTNISIAPSSQPSQQCFEFASKGKKDKSKRRLKLEKGVSHKLPTKSFENRNEPSISPFFQTSAPSAVYEEGRNETTKKGKDINKATKAPTAKGKGISKAPEAKGKSVSKAPKAKGKGKTLIGKGKGKKHSNRKCKKSKGECNKKKSKEKRAVPEKVNKVSVHFEAKIFSNTTTFTSTQNDTILEDLNTFFVGGARGCDISMQEMLEDENIISLKFVKLLIDDGKVEIKGLDGRSSKSKTRFSQILILTFFLLLRMQNSAR